ncbi:hypothetical protein ScPMuIL_011413 [Solemya velum]
MSLGKADFGVTTFFASSHPNDKCGVNGLPLTPNSIKVLGRFHFLTTLRNPSLCNYLEILKGKHECLVIISEYFQQNLKKLCIEKKLSETDILKLAFEILEGLVYLNCHGIVHRNLSQENILFDPEGHVKLSEYGMYHMTDWGTSVSFPIGLPQYMAPETLCGGPVQVEEYTDKPIQPPCGPKVDIWTLGLVLVEVIMGEELWNSLTLQQTIYKTLEFIKRDLHPLDVIMQEHKNGGKLRVMTKGTLDLLRQMLNLSPSQRPSAAELLKHQVFKDMVEEESPYENGYRLFTSEMRSKNLELPRIEDIGNDQDEDIDHLSLRSMEEVHYLWKLAGGDVENVLTKAGLLKTKSPIHLIPRYKSLKMQYTILMLYNNQRKILDSTSFYLLYPIVSKIIHVITHRVTPSPSSVDLSETANLPLVIREKDVDYQFHRIILYDRLLKAYPYKRAHIWKEARVDIPPLYRAYVWAALLEVEGDIQALYDSIDKETPTFTDRQIEVDIPRCHQYHELLSSPTAHAKFKRVLKAWVVSHRQYVYWQGLDSLCAPFLSLNFNNEALAYSCLAAFIPKYLHKFFLKDNSAVIQEYLAVFTHLIAFHDPELSNHLDGIGFIPDLYAIPWFLTMYAHVFPLHKIVHLWDTLLLGNSSFPLCIGVAILQQLRDRLLSFGFNECILLFSDMPEIDIQKCVQESIRIFCQTPKSATFRQHARPSQREKKSENRPNLSYYSRDYNYQQACELSMEAVSIEELKSEKCPRISAEDLIELGELAGPVNSRSPTKKKPTSKPKLLVIDVRMPEDYKRGTTPDSVNIPFQTGFSPEGDLIPCPAVQALDSHKSQIKVVVGNRGRNAANFAGELVRLKYSRVCVLHKGIDVLRSTAILTIPPADI